MSTPPSTSSATADDGLWLRRFAPRPEAAVRLVCLPHAGGSASFYLPVARAMPDFVDVLCVQYPGRQDRHSEEPLDSVAALADGVFAALQSWTDKPLAFFGHSMGASVAFEVARRFERERDIVGRALIVSARWAPSARRRESVHLRDDNGLLDELRSLSGTDTSLLDDEEVVRMVLPALRADYRAAETYAPELADPLKCPVLALTGDADPKVTEEEVAAWSQHTTGPFSLRVFSGGHFYLAGRQAEVIGAMADQLREVTVS